MFRIENKKRFYTFVFGVIVLVSALSFGIYKTVRWYKRTPAIEGIGIKEASKMGEKKTVQLLIQIADVKDVDGALERGDVLLTAPEDKQFSLAEQEGFLIIKMRLTQSEQDLLALSLKEKTGIFVDEDKMGDAKEIKRRKFAVDLAKIGISPEEKVGRVIVDKVFEDDALIEKR